MVASPNADGPGLRYGVSSMCLPLRRVLVRRPATVGDFAAAAWRQPDPGLLLAQHEALEAAGVPVVARLDGAARADGGDFVWLDRRTLIIGRSYRTNAAGVAQLRTIMAAEGVTVLSVDLPHDLGPEHVLHLMSFLSPVADDLAVVFPPLAPVALMEILADRGVAVVAVDAGEYAAMACNVLAVRPRQVIMLEGTPVTRRALERHGCEVHCYDGSEISLKGDGGPTCLTQPLLRAG